MIAEIKNISKQYRNSVVLSNISLTLESGRCYGLVGKNGTGKSSLISIIAGVLKPDEGEIFIDGENVLKNTKLISAHVGYVPQQNPLIEELSGLDNLRLYYSENDLKKELKDGVLKLLGIDEFVKNRVSKMSGGMKKRLSIGCAMEGHPSILLLDEPGAGLDLICKKIIRDYISDFTAHGGIVLIATHEKDEIDICDKLYVLKDGKLSELTYGGEMEKLINAI